MNIRPYPEPLWFDRTIADRLPELEHILRTGGPDYLAAKLEYLALTSPDPSEERAKWLRR